MSDDRPVVVPPATIGMLGGGQLGKYALTAANAMGYRTIVLDPDPGAPAAVVANEHLVAGYDDPAALARLAQECSVITTEFENPPAAALERLAESTVVAPDASAVAIAQDRIAEKQFMVDHGIAVGPHVAVRGGDGRSTTAVAIAERGAVVKTARLGYDGQGQRRVKGPDELAAALTDLGDVDCIVEELLDLQTELSVIVGCTPTGEIEAWPVAENIHVDGILDVSVVPARIDDELAAQAVALATSVARALGYVGVLAVEMFVVDDGSIHDLLVNEVAPRPHNSGHWTLDASVTSQFEQQIRAVCGVGLGTVAMTAPAAAMVNLLGELWFTHDDDRQVEPAWAAALADPDATLHVYGKSEPRPGRKMGHLTVTADTADDAIRRATALRTALAT